MTRQLVSTFSMVDRVGTAIVKADGATSKAILRATEGWHLRR